MEFPYKKALVTGGAGFIGSHIIERLLGLGVEVVCVDDYTTGKIENLADFSRERLQVAECSVADYDALRRWFDGVDIVFHNAASKKTVCMDNPRLDLDVNAKGAFNVLELSRDFGVSKVVHASTGSVYGEAKFFPQSETHPLDPTSYYGVSKLAGEKYCTLFCREFDMDITVLRYFHVYGSRQDFSDGGGVVAIFSTRSVQDRPLYIHGDGTQQRSFTYIDDLVDINMLVATDPRSRGEVYNCASGIKVSIQELAENIRGLAGRPDLEIRYDDWMQGDIKIFDVDNSKIKGLGFEFKTSFDVGLKETFNWFAARADAVEGATAASA
jgi:UDP-glucose 4-epimerase